MNIESVVRTISLVIAPAVLITSCAILLGGLLQRYEALSTRMRAMNQERFELLRGVPPAGDSAPGATARLTEERRQEIDAQLPRILGRHRMLRDAIVLLYLAILVFVLSMCLIALAVVTEAAVVAALTLIVFLVGTGLLLGATLFTVLEVYRSYREVAYEVERTLQFRR
jgi:hypothetical protein